MNWKNNSLISVFNNTQSLKSINCMVFVTINKRLKQIHRTQTLSSSDSNDSERHETQRVEWLWIQFIFYRHSLVVEDQRLELVNEFVCHFFSVSNRVHFVCVSVDQQLWSDCSEVVNRSTLIFGTEILEIHCVKATFIITFLCLEWICDGYFRFEVNHSLHLWPPIAKVRHIRLVSRVSRDWSVWVTINLFIAIQSLWTFSALWVEVQTFEAVWSRWTTNESHRCPMLSRRMIMTHVDNEAEHCYVLVLRIFELSSDSLWIGKRLRVSRWWRIHVFESDYAEIAIVWLIVLHLIHYLIDVTRAQPCFKVLCRLNR